MKFYFAPLEGITGYLFRNIHHQMFPELDRYYSPFISPGLNRNMNPKERKDVCPENQKGVRLIPQIMVNHPEPFISIAKELFEMGYREINLNLGCPSGTVVSKKKGAGLLGETQMLEALLEEIYRDPFMETGEMKLSVKTRLGMREDWEFEELLEIYKRFPLAELIVHARVREDYYRGKTRTHIFKLAYDTYEGELCYNGDVFTKNDYDGLIIQFPDLNSMMLGRGLLFNPALAREIKGGACLTKAELEQYHQLLLEAFMESQSGDRNVLFRTKELWFYMGQCFAGADKELKVIRKTNQLAQYQDAVRSIFRDCELQTDKRPVF